METYDAIVIGLGGMGSAALYQLAKRGLKVLGIEQFGIGHDRGSSHGETRIIRRAYFEHPDYVPLVDLCYTDWATLQRECNIKLIDYTGLLLAGPADGDVIGGTRRAAKMHGLAIETFSAKECSERYPGIIAPKGAEILFESNAGFLRVEECVRAYVERATAFGATTLPETSMLNWRADGNRFLVEAQGTPTEILHPEADPSAQDEANKDVPAKATVEPKVKEFAAENLIICGGPWSTRLLADLRLPLEVLRKPVMWFPINDSTYRLDQGFPVFGIETGKRFLYGFPSIDGATLKIADHTGGDRVEDPTAVNRELHSSDTKVVKRFVADHLPGVSGDVARHSVCMYTMTPDQHFIVDRHPQHSRVCFVAGLSGHGFKFAPVIGSALADLAAGEKLPENMDFLSLRRFGSTSH